jgi:hypothetical protein
VPIDDVDTFEEILDAAALSHDFFDKPHYKYRTLMHGLVLLLQEPSDGPQG